MVPRDRGELIVLGQRPIGAFLLRDALLSLSRLFWSECFGCEADRKKQQQRTPSSKPRTRNNPEYIYFYYFNLGQRRPVTVLKGGHGPRMSKTV